MEFVPKVSIPGEHTQQLKLHQSTLFESVERAHRNKQREHQQQQDEAGGGDYTHYGQQQDEAYTNARQKSTANNSSNVAAAAAAVDQQPAARKRKRSTVAAAAINEVRPGSRYNAAAAAAASGGKGVVSGCRRRRSSKAVAVPEGALEELDTWQLSSSNNNTSTTGWQRRQQQQETAQIIDATLPDTAAWQELQQVLASAEGVALGLLYSSTVAAPGGQALAVQFFTSLQLPSKQQLMLLSKAAAAAKKQAATSAVVPDAADAAAAQEPTDAAGVLQVVGIAVMPVTGCNSSTQEPAVGAEPTSDALHTYFVQLQGEAAALPPHVLQLLQAVLCDPGLRPCVCCGAKAVLSCLAQQGLVLPGAGAVSLVDPELLGWLLDPQLVQDTKQEACYSLEQQLRRLGQQVTACDGPLQRLHHQLQQSLQLTSLLHMELSGAGGVSGQAIKLEMQVATILVKMEVCGVACAPRVLSDHRATLAARLAFIKGRATMLVGREFNLSSSSQLAKVLYEDLRLTPPAGGGGRGAAKTHLSTNEITLKQLAASHELPGLVLEHRCIMNVMSKWIDAQWVQQAAQHAGGRVHCTWQQTCTATGRLSSCAPNLQAVTKYTITAQDSSSGPKAAAALGGSAPASSLLTINVRDAFVAPAGKLLLSADYSQIELRLLAHFSEDPLLRQILSQSTGDVFNMIAAVLQQAGNRHDNRWQGAAVPTQVSPEERERAKRVVYGIVYGQTPYGLAQQLVDQGINTAAAQGLIDGFLARFPGVRGFMSRSISSAQASGAVSTLMGRRRPIPGLTAGDFQERSAAERKVVNSQIQGSAADLIKVAMCAWDEWAMQAQQIQQPSGSTSQGVQAQLIAQIHDELLFEVDAADAELGPDGALQHPGQHFLQVAAAVKGIMESAAPLTVPLRVKLAWGHSWGSLADLEV